MGTGLRSRHPSVDHEGPHRAGAHRLSPDASAEKGEILFRAFTADVVALLERVIAWDGAEWDA